MDPPLCGKEASKYKYLQKIVVFCSKTAGTPSCSNRSELRYGPEAPSGPRESAGRIRFRPLCAQAPAPDYSGAASGKENAPVPRGACSYRLDLGPAARRAERVAHVGRPARTPRERTSCWGEGWLRGASRGDTGARRGDAGGRARVKSGFIFPILLLFLHHTLSGK